MSLILYNKRLILWPIAEFPVYHIFRNMYGVCYFKRVVSLEETNKKCLFQITPFTEFQAHFRLEIIL